MVISFLGPDGSGKSTIIDQLRSEYLPFLKTEYFHLKPIKTTTNSNIIVTNPHKYPEYSKFKSYCKLIFFLFQYNICWLVNIYPLKYKSVLIIFDRYFDDLLVDHRRYRYGGSIRIAKFIRLFIPKPHIYFILTADAKIIHKRKKEVSISELERQITAYNLLADNKRYIKINVDNSPKEISKKIISVINSKLNE